jgi:hypothetical protein
MRRTAGLLLTLALACAQRCVAEELACENRGTLHECTNNVRAAASTYPEPLGLDLHL